MRESGGILGFREWPVPGAFRGILVIVGESIGVGQSNTRIGVRGYFFFSLVTEFSGFSGRNQCHAAWDCGAHKDEAVWARGFLRRGEGELGTRIQKLPKRFKFRINF